MDQYPTPLEMNRDRLLASRTARTEHFDKQPPVFFADERKKWASEQTVMRAQENEHRDEWIEGLQAAPESDLEKMHQLMTTSYANYIDSMMDGINTDPASLNDRVFNSDKAIQPYALDISRYKMQEATDVSAQVMKHESTDWKDGLKSDFSRDTTIPLNPQRADVIHEAALQPADVLHIQPAPQAPKTANAEDDRVEKLRDSASSYDTHKQNFDTWLSLNPEPTKHQEIADNAEWFGWQRGHKQLSTLVDEASKAKIEYGEYQATQAQELKFERSQNEVMGINTDQTNVRVLDTQALRDHRATLMQPRQSEQIESSAQPATANDGRFEKSAQRENEQSYGMHATELHHAAQAGRSNLEQAEHLDRARNGMFDPKDYGYTQSEYKGRVQNEQGPTSLWDAQTAQHVHNIMSQKDRPDINARNDQGQTALFGVKDLDAAHAMVLDYNASVHVKDENGRLALHANQSGEIQSFLVKQGSDVQAKDEFGKSAIHYAQDKQAAETMISYGADVNQSSRSGEIPLHNAAKHGRADVAQTLLTNGADVNTQDKQGNVPLARAETQDVAQVLLNNNANTDVQNKAGQTPAQSTAKQGNADASQAIEKQVNQKAQQQTQSDTESYTQKNTQS